jgi:hypothetical protein
MWSPTMTSTIVSPIASAFFTCGSPAIRDDAGRHVLASATCGGVEG